VFSVPVGTFSSRGTPLQLGSWQVNAWRKLQQGIVIGALPRAMAGKRAEIGRLCRLTGLMIVFLLAAQSYRGIDTCSPPQRLNKPPSYKPSSSSVVQSGAKLVPNALSISSAAFFKSSHVPFVVMLVGPSSFAYVRVEQPPTRDRRPRRSFPSKNANASRWHSGTRINISLKGIS